MTFRAYADNVVLEFVKPNPQAEGAVVIVESGKATARGHRIARVVASGPGYTRRSGVFIANEVKTGDRVVVDALAGQDYAMDLSVPRHNKSAEFQDLFGDRGEFRIVREEEILGVLE
jgi:co-chaperonin GroES (HSP10)